MPINILLLKCQVASFFIDVVFLTYAWAAAAITVKRWHDLDKSPWWLLTIFIPIWNILASFELLFVKGKEKKNNYGEQETQNETFKIIGFLCLIVIFILVIYRLAS